MKKAEILKKIPVKIKKRYIVLALAIFILAAALGAGLLLHEKPKEKPVPSVSIGCDRVLWKDTELELTALTKNIDKPVFEWTVDGRSAGTGQKLRKKFDIGEHRVVLNVSFDNRTLTAKQSTTVIDSADGVSMRDSVASKNQWGFQTLYKGKSTGVKEVMVSVDSSPPSEVNPCGVFTSKGLFAGDHTWRAEYRGHTIASGTFNLKEVSDIKLDSIEVAPNYNAGDTVNGKIVVKNTGTVPVTAFDIKTVAVNNNYAWMGDKAKREFSDQFTGNIKPGETYEIPVSVTIPEKVSGVRPSGKYTITVTLMLAGQAMDKKAVNTQVK